MSPNRKQLLLLGVVLAVGIAAGVWIMSIPGGNHEPAAPTLEDTDLRVEVVNGCGVSGAADRVASILRRAGYRVEHVGNADHFHYREDLVVARRVGLSQAESLGRVLGGVAVVEQAVPGYDYDVTVIVAKPRPLISEEPRKR